VVSTESRFWPKVDKRGDTECWPWQAGTFQFGHGLLRDQGRLRKAHRISWELHFGEIPDGLCVCHRCDNPPCVNPSHLFLGTQRDNIADRDQKGRTARGDRSGSRLHPEALRRGEANKGGGKLTTEQVAAMRQRYTKSPISYVQLGKLFGVSHIMARNIVLRRTGSTSSGILP
jgi:hypothetical protein